MRLQLFALAYNLAKFLRRLALPKPVRQWSLTTLGEKLIKIGAKVVRHAGYVTFQMAEVCHTAQAVGRFSLGLLGCVRRFRFFNQGDDSMCVETMDDSHGRRGSSALKFKNGQVWRLLRTNWDANGPRKVALPGIRRYTGPHRTSLIGGAEPNRKSRLG